MKNMIKFKVERYKTGKPQFLIKGVAMHDGLNKVKEFRSAYRNRENFKWYSLNELKNYDLVYVQGFGEVQDFNELEEEYKYEKRIFQAVGKARNNLNVGGSLYEENEGKN